MAKYLVKVVETYEHTYLVEADSEEKARSIVESNSEGCNTYDDFCDTDYLVREPNEHEDLSLYDECIDRESRLER